MFCKRKCRVPFPTSAARGRFFRCCLNHSESLSFAGVHGKCLMGGLALLSLPRHARSPTPRYSALAVYTRGAQRKHVVHYQRSFPVFYCYSVGWSEDLTIAISRRLPANATKRANNRQPENKEVKRVIRVYHLLRGMLHTFLYTPLLCRHIFVIILPCLLYIKRHVAALVIPMQKLQLES